MLKLIGILLPFITDVINRRFANSDVRFAVSMAVCAVAGIGVCAIESSGFQGFLTINDTANAISEDILSMVAISQIMYHQGYEDSSIHYLLRKGSKAPVAEKPEDFDK